MLEPVPIHAPTPLGSASASSGTLVRWGNPTIRSLACRSSRIHRSSACSRSSTVIPWCRAMLFKTPDKVLALIGLWSGITS